MSEAMSKRTTRETWLLDAAALDDSEVLYLYPRGDLDQSAALAALDAQYGRGSFDTWQHGNALRVARRAFSHHGEVYRRFSEANEHFWAARKEGLPQAEIDKRRDAVKEPREVWNGLFKKRAITAGERQT
jgi:hypothetical protein